ncbi:hypothetical protein AMK13_24685 [Streptomyces sp. CB02056]|nr:hypothetical protein AMK13_24685 [Streptomyces sp. CB02056]
MLSPASQRGYLLHDITPPVGRGSSGEDGTGRALEPVRVGRMSAFAQQRGVRWGCDRTSSTGQECV